MLVNLDRLDSFLIPSIRLPAPNFSMNERLPTIAHIAEFLEDWAPPASAQSYDNVGLQVGNPASSVRKALLALDMTPDVLGEATAAGASLVITHHPLIFKPLRELTSRSFVSNLALRLAETRTALYSIHTNLDAASGGVSFALGERLGLRGLTFLEPFDEEGRATGMGAVGSLDAPMLLEDFLARVSERLSAGALRYAGDPDATVLRVAVCGGAGADFVDRALAAGADAYVTSDVKYHQYFDVLDVQGRPQMAFIDAGHYETEAMTVDVLRERLARQFPAVDWQITETRTSPMRTFSTLTQNAP